MKKHRVRIMMVGAVCVLTAGMATLRSITQGRGVYTMSLSHYEQVPSHIASEIIAQAQKEKEEE